MTTAAPFRPKVDTQFFKDNRSRAYGTRQIVGRTARFKRVWTTRKEPLDQGQEGECVGYSFASELAAKPHAYSVDNGTGHKVFTASREVDREEGRYFPEGATMLAGAKACQRAHYFFKYGWCFGKDDVLNWLCRKGPVLLGIEWHEESYDPSPDGLISIGGPVVGGHSIMANGFWPAHPKFGDVVVLTNTWGSSWGLNGRGYLPVESLDVLLKADGEAVAPTEFLVHPI